MARAIRARMVMASEEYNLEGSIVGGQGECGFHGGVLFVVRARIAL